MKKIKINPKKKLFYWGPTDGHPIFPDFWNLGMYYFSKTYKPGWAETIIYFEKERMTFVCEWGKLYDYGEIIFKKYVLNKAKFRKAYQGWENALKNFKKIAVKIEKIKLADISDKELASLFLEFSSFYSEEFWYNGLLAEIANWGGEQLLTRELKKRISGESDFIYALERLTAPENYSFHQEEELDLLAIRLERNKKKWERKIIEHQKKYFWILNNYHHTKILPVVYFKKELVKMSIEDAKLKTREIRKLKEQAIASKKQVARKFKLPPSILTISRKLSFCIWWQDIRKAYIFQSNHIVSLFIKEFSSRYGINIDDLYFYTAKDLKKLVRGRGQNKNEIKKRKNNFLIYYIPGRRDTCLFSGMNAKKSFQPYIRKNVEKNIRELKGLVVNQGVARGRVKILTNPAEMGKMTKGDILVTTMTTPDYIVALRKASALITDEGGMTCHAAIVSRELKIPGIVATKIATRVLNDGDTVEVDANKGVVKILKK